MPLPAATPPAASPLLSTVLSEALASRLGGEVVIKSPTVSGRIFVIERKVAWAVVTEPGGARFSDVLVAAGLVTHDEVAQTVAECRRKGSNFCETLIAWNLVPRDRLRELLRQHVARNLRALGAVPQAQALFVPQPRSYASTMTFELDELLALDTAAPVVPIPPVILEGEAMSNVKQSLEDTLKIEGAFAACLVDSKSGMCLGSVGSGLNMDAAAAGNTEVLRAKMKTMNALNIKDKIEDILISLGEQYHLIRPLSSREGLFLYLALHRANANLGMARFRLAEIEKTLAV